MCYVDARSALMIAPVGRLGLTFVNIGNPASFGKSASRPRPPKGEVTLSFGISRCCRVRHRMVILIGEAVCPCFGIHYYRHSPCFGIVHRKATKSYRTSVLAPINSGRGKLVTIKEIISHPHVRLRVPSIAVWRGSSFRPSGEPALGRVMVLLGS